MEATGSERAGAIGGRRHATAGPPAGARRSPVVTALAVVLILAALGLTGIAVAGLASPRLEPPPTPPPTSPAAVAMQAPPPRLGDVPVTQGLEDRASCPPTVVACVDTRLQRSWLQRGGVVIYGPVPFMPGAQTGIAPPGPESSATPLGHFQVLSKNADQVSSEFNNEPMPNAVFFAPGGIAFHQGSLGGSSHGCVHLDPAAAKAYFDQLGPGDNVTVF